MKRSSLKRLLFRSEYVHIREKNKSGYRCKAFSNDIYFEYKCNCTVIYCDLVIILQNQFDLSEQYPLQFNITK